MPNGLKFTTSDTFSMTWILKRIILLRVLLRLHPIMSWLRLKIIPFIYLHISGLSAIDCDYYWSYNYLSCILTIAGCKKCMHGH